jgi:hypothetical protein
LRHHLPFCDCASPADRISRTVVRIHYATPWRVAS